jgi:hypothetical protein
MTISAEQMAGWKAVLERVGTRDVTALRSETAYGFFVAAKIGWPICIAEVERLQAEMAQNNGHAANMAQRLNDKDAEIARLNAEAEQMRTEAGEGMARLLGKVNDRDTEIMRLRQRLAHFEAGFY